MGYTIDIDTGGTFTDGFIFDGSRYEKVKVDTTPHDLTVCFGACLEQAAGRFGLGLPELLRKTDVVRFSTTIGTNTLVQRKGPKVGVLVTRGNEHDLYAKPGAASPLLQTIVDPKLVTGLDEDIGDDGSIRKALAPDEVREAVRGLLDGGARIIAVALRNGYRNPIHEKMVHSLVREWYPRHYLGAVPVLLASDLSHGTDAERRLGTVVLNAYFFREMARYLYRADEDARRAGLERPLLVTHSSGGTARVAKTRAIDTYNSGPAAGILGSHKLARMYGLPSVVTFDVGGTTTDIALLGGGVPFNLRPSVEGIPVDVPIIEVDAIGAAGGSIARVSGRVVTVGPDSTGAVPGPAGYELGGTEATPTDAALVLGLIDPDYFLGGRRRLNLELAQNAIRERVAEPLGVSLPEAARLVNDAVEEQNARVIRQHLAGAGLDPSSAVLFAFGGAGGLFAAGAAQRAGLKSVYTFPFASVFAAFGSSTADVLHVYRARVPDGASGLSSLAAPLAGFRDRALRDMRGEGFSPAQVTWACDLEVEKNGAPDLISIDLPGDESQDWVDHMAGALGSNGAGLVAFHLKAAAAIPHFELVPQATAGADAGHALKGKRAVFWRDAWLETPVFDRDGLRPGNLITGPAIVETTDATCVVPPGVRFIVDRYLTGIIEEV